MSSFKILSNSSPLDHERFSAHRELETRLKGTIKGEVRFDMGSRALYATDSSNYRQLPIGVVIPRDEDDVELALAACRAVGAAVLPRGAGTSLAGQCANVAVVFDYSKYMNRLVTLDPRRKLAVVEPGIVLDRLREAAEKHQLTYGPDPATHNRCTLGGMIGNNSCGVHGLLAGKVVDNVESLDVVTYDGTRMNVGPTRPDQLQELIRRGGRWGQIYEGLKKIRDKYAGLIREKYPRIPRRVSGYNLDELLPENGFNVARALVGSEGTCVNILSATLNLTSSPQHRVLTVLAFADAFSAADAVPHVLQHRPIGLEGFDSMLVEFMRRKGISSGQLEQPPPGSAFLLVEMGADSEVEAHAKAQQIAREAECWPERPIAHICNREEAANMWHVRESALGAVVFVPGEPNRYEGWEDAAVPPEMLGVYLRAIHRLMDEYGYSSPVYGHYGQGCVHMRINFDFSSQEGIEKFREFIDRAADVVLRFGGSLSGEHGDGQSRAALLPKMFGPELMQAFHEFKKLWDPDNRMNPGKLVDAVRVYDPVENLRDAPPSGKKSRSRRHLETHFVFAADNGSMAHATERCVGVGACRKTSGGVMCPSYRATGEELHSTRGRAHLLWEMLSGDLRSEGFQSNAVDEALSLCLSCKACKSECPVQVDMARYKAEFLAQRYRRWVHPLHHYLLGYADKLARWGSIMPRVTNDLLTSPLAKKFARIAAERDLPRLADKPYTKLSTDTASDSERSSSNHQVVLWPDTWNNYYHPDTLAAADSLLTEAGFSVILPQGHICCGRPLYDFGLLRSARAYLARVLERMAPYIDSGLPFVFMEPSCASVFKDELPELFPAEPRAEKLRDSVWLLADFLAANASKIGIGRLHGKTVRVHGHCHHKAVFGGPSSEVELLRQAGADVELIEAGCCGMAGPFGFEAEKFAVSKAIANQDLLPALEKAPSDTLVVADGFSCREQIEHLAHRHALHFAEALARGGKRNE